MSKIHAATEDDMQNEIDRLQDENERIREALKTAMADYDNSNKSIVELLTERERLLTDAIIQRDENQRLRIALYMYAHKLQTQDAGHTARAALEAKP